MIAPLFAQILAGYSLLQLLVIVIVVVSAVAITFIVLRQMGFAPPPWVTQIGWIVAVAVFGILALFVLFELVGRVR